MISLQVLWDVAQRNKILGEEENVDPKDKS